MASPPVTKQHLSHLHLAIIDDDPVILQLLAQQLKCSGVGRCDLYSKGSNALEHIHQLQPDIVICDLMLTDIDGPQLIRALARRGWDNFRARGLYSHY